MATTAGRRSLILLIKLLHSLIYLFMSACIAYLYYAAFTDRFGWALWLALGAILLEVAALLLSGRRCPLTLLALRLGDETGDDLIADWLLPRALVRRTVPFCTLLFLGGLLAVGVAAWRL